MTALYILTMTVRIEAAASPKDHVWSTSITPKQETASSPPNGVRGGRFHVHRAVACHKSSVPNGVRRLLVQGPPNKRGNRPMLSVFLAGNYGDVDTAIAMCNNLDEEFATYLPHLAKATKIERWREHAQFFLGKCDCVLKLKDQCVASIYDVKLAQEQNIPVFNNYTELLQFSREGL